MEHLTFEQLPEAIGRILTRLDEIEQLLLTNQAEGIKDETMDVKQAAEYLKLKIPTVYSKVSRRELPFNKPGKNLHFLKSELFAWIQAGRKKTKQEINNDVGTHLKKTQG